VRGFGQANTYDNKLGDQCLILLFILYKSNRTPLKYAIQNILFGKVCVTGEIQPPTYGLEVRHSTQPALFYECQTNVPLYPNRQDYFRNNQPPTLIVWWKIDYNNNEL